MGGGLGIIARMKPTFLALSLVALLLSLNACKTTGPQATNVGPFDANGNYIEAWADDPSKWRTYKPKDLDGGDPPVYAKNEQPPDHAVPLVTGAPVSTKPTPTKPVVSSPRSTPASSEVAHRTTTKPRETVSSSPKSKPKPTVAKAKPKTKPKPTVVRYTVKSGDSLSTIAARNGTSVAALKSANGISGTLIHPGKSLVIPRRK